MKKIINNPNKIVKEMCKGIVAAYPGLEFDDTYNFIRKKNIDKDKVTLISGGGSGHEPAHAGFIGDGMLDVAVCGDVFASPSQIQVYKAIKSCCGNKGTLLIIKNYTGDDINFKNAMEMAHEDGLNVDCVISQDDIAVKDSLYTVGKRGVAGTLFVHKIAGAAAKEGLDLSSVKHIAQRVIDNTRSLGFALTSCIVPAKGTPTFSLENDEIEFGVGIHGEPGINRQKIESADKLAFRLVDSLVSNLQVSSGDELALIVNGFGGTPLQELYVLNNSIMEILKKKKIKASRVYVGNFVTSLEMAGASLSILKLDDELKKYLIASVSTPAFNLFGNEVDSEYKEYDEVEERPEGIYVLETPNSYSKIQNNKLNLNNFLFLIDKMSAIIIENEKAFCELDSHAGDGDFGMSIASGFRALKQNWASLKECVSISSFLNESSLIIMEKCGGSSGPIWGSAFRSAANSTKGKVEINTSDMANLIQKSVEAIQLTGEKSFGRGAVVGDKTLIDALAPCADEWLKNSKEGISMVECFKLGAEEAVKGAKATEQFVARMGRAGTVGERSIGYPDAGAFGLGVIFTEMAKSLK